MHGFPITEPIELYIVYVDDVASYKHNTSSHAWLYQFAVFMIVASCWHHRRYVWSAYECIMLHQYKQIVLLPNYCILCSPQAQNLHYYQICQLVVQKTFHCCHRCLIHHHEYILL